MQPSVTVRLVLLRARSIYPPARLTGRQKRCSRSVAEGLTSHRSLDNPPSSMKGGDIIGLFSSFLPAIARSEIADVSGTIERRANGVCTLNSSARPAPRWPLKRAEQVMATCARK